MLETSFYSLGTVNTIYTLKDDCKDVINKVIARVQEIDDKMSAYKVNSEISLISRFSGVKAIKVSDETYRLIAISKKFSKLSNGLYDITIGPLSKLYKFKDDKVPSEDEITKAKALVNYKNMILYPLSKKVYLRKKGMEIDLGSIAKGYAVDEAVKILKENNIKDALLNFGGDIYALGNDEYTKLWNIGIQNPLKERGTSFLNINVKDKAVVTSSVNEQFTIKDSKFYHHIINPKTGYPLDLNLLSVTIINESSMLADALSTVSFLVGMEEANKLIKKENSKAIYIDKNQFVFASFDVKETA